MKNPPEDLHLSVLRELISDVYNHIHAGKEFFPFIHQRLRLNQNEVWSFTDWQAPPQEKALKLYSILLGKGKSVVDHLFLALLDSSQVLPSHYILATTLKKKRETFVICDLFIDIASPYVDMMIA